MPICTALLLIDVQESFRTRPYFRADEFPQFCARTQRLIDGFTQSRLPVVQIFHVESSGPFAMESGLVRTLPEITCAPSAIIYKTVHSALAGTNLQHWLIQHGIGRVVIAGIRTEQCCETTARHASDLGFEVDFVTEATLTFPMTHANGRTFDAQQIRERTELVLAQRFATIVGVDEALGRAR